VLRLVTRAPSTPADRRQIDPLDDVDVTLPEPSVAVIADEAGLRRRLLAALDFDRLPLSAQGEQPSDVLPEAANRPRTVAVLTAPRSDTVAEALAQLRRDLPDAPIVLVVQRVECATLRRALRAGAAAAVPETHVESALALAVRAAAAGLMVAPQALREELA
jgi:DNA-binding NarL/FixJ family response regulator